MKKNKLNKKVKSGLRYQLTNLAIVPLIFAGIIVMFVVYLAFYKTMSSQVNQELKNLVLAVQHEYGRCFDTEYTFSLGEDGRYILAGEDIDETYLNDLRDESGIDLTLFYYDIRLLTTLTDENGESINGTVASKKIAEAVLKQERSLFIDNADINGEEFYGYYVPAYNSKGEAVGMYFAGKPTTEIKQLILNSAWPVFLAIITVMIFASIASASLANKLAEVINKEKNFLGEIAAGNFKATLDADVLKREDELGEMGSFTVKVQKFIRDMIERDALTKLYTRRIGEAKIAATRQEFIDYGVKYCMVMCDIDHFKRFNDTYGHDCGDLVLRSVADAFNRMMFGRGYAIRWGGEEFIIIMENVDKEAAYEILKEVRQAVLDTVVEYKEEQLKVTMTYGLIEGDDREIHVLVKEVDDLLYEGKEAGRDRIVVSSN